MKNLMKKSKKGFTLMEMLIVVAIIAILVVIAIPTFTNALTEAREGADLANIRAWYAEEMLDVLLNDSTFGTYDGPALQAIADSNISYSGTVITVTTAHNGTVVIGG